MTEAINYLQALFSFNNLITSPVSGHDAKLVKTLVKDARSLVQLAEAEAQHGATAYKLMQAARKNSTRRLQREMAIIALWHLNRSLNKFQDAAARYSEAGRIQTKQSRIFFAEARAMAKMADEIEVSIKSFNNF